MSFNPMTHKQAQALAQFVNALRPDWDAPGVEDALGKARQLAPAADLAIAAIRAATSPSNRTPGVIPLQGPHWRGSDVTPQRKFDPRKFCHVCGKPEPVCRDARDHPFLSVEQARAVRSAPVPASIRAALHGAPTEEETP